MSQQSKSEVSTAWVQRLARKMRLNGYDVRYPVSAVIGPNNRVVISDGHHRVRAAILAGIEKIPVDVHAPDGGRNGKSL